MKGFNPAEVKLGFFFKLYRFMRAGIGTSRCKTNLSVYKMGTACALLSHLKLSIEINSPIGAGINAKLAAGAFFGVNDNQPIGSGVYSSHRATYYTRSIVTMLARYKHMGYLNMRYLSPLGFVHFTPKMPPFRLRLGIGGPIVAAVLVLTCNLALVTPTALFNIYNKSLHFYLPPSTHVLNNRP
jgi:hypothetical protein